MHYNCEFGKFEVNNETDSGLEKLSNICRNNLAIILL